MSTLKVLDSCEKLIFTSRNLPRGFADRGRRIGFFQQLRRSGSRLRISKGFVPNAKKKARGRSWWQRIFLDDGNWLGLEDGDMLDAEAELIEEEGREEKEKFEAWRRRAEAIVELREAQEDMLNEESSRWEDWILDDDPSSPSSWYSPNSDADTGADDDGGGGGGVGVWPPSQKGFAESVRDLVIGGEEEDLLYEDRVFRYASSNSAKFLAILILVPLALDFVVHDYVLMPFLDRYVKKVPLAAQMLDVRRNQKLEIVRELNMEKARIRLEVEIGKSPPLTDEEMWWELRHKALELRDEGRLENRRAFANILSDMLFGLSMFVLLYFNQNQVALLKFTGYKILNNISDAGKAFLIILIADILLGYHSESGWQSFSEIILEHYGFEVDQSAITIFVCVVPVFIDACVKFWLYKFLPRLSPKVPNIIREMKRH